MNWAPDSKEHAFELKVCRALDDNVARLPASTVNRLAAARRAAIARKKPERVAVTALVPMATPMGAAHAAHSPRRASLLARLARAWPLIVLAGSIVSAVYWENMQRTTELADIDAAMLSDDLPLNAYLDHGFNAYLLRAH